MLRPEGDVVINSAAIDTQARIALIIDERANMHMFAIAILAHAGTPFQAVGPPLAFYA